MKKLYLILSIAFLCLCLTAIGKYADSGQAVEESKVRIIKAKSDDWTEVDNWVGGQGKILIRQVEGIIEGYENSILRDVVMKPGAYTGYHRHVGWEEYMFIVSGKLEHYQNGERTVLGPGDTIVLGKQGGVHAFKNIGDEDLRALCVYVLPTGVEGNIDVLPFPDDLADWK